jgi:hypothetical protein
MIGLPNLKEYQKIKKKLIFALKKLLHKYQKPIKEHPNLRTHIIMLLGFFKEEIVIEQFEKDLREIDNIFRVQQDYWNEYTAEIIENSRMKLFNLEREMFKERELIKKQKEKTKDKIIKTELEIKENNYKNKGLFVRQVKYGVMDLLGLIEKENNLINNKWKEEKENISSQKALKLYKALREIIKEDNSILPTKIF